MPRGKQTATELTISQLQARSRFLDRLLGAITKLAKEDGIELTLPIKKRRKRGPNVDKKKVTRAKAAKPKAKAKAPAAKAAAPKPKPAVIPPVPPTVAPPPAPEG